MLRVGKVDLRTVGVAVVVFIILGLFLGSYVYADVWKTPIESGKISGELQVYLLDENGNRIKVPAASILPLTWIYKNPSTGQTSKISMICTDVLTTVQGTPNLMFHYTVKLHVKLYKSDGYRDWLLLDKTYTSSGTEYVGSDGKKTFTRSWTFEPDSIITAPEDGFQYTFQFTAEVTVTDDSGTLSDTAQTQGSVWVTLTYEDDTKTLSVVSVEVKAKPY